MIAITFNFLVFVACLYFGLRKPVKEALELRHITLKDSVERVRTQLEEAQRSLQEFEGKFRQLESEKTAMMAFSKQDAEILALKRLNDARRISQGVVSDAELASRSLGEQLERELRTDFGNRVLAKAESQLVSKLTGEDRVRFVKDFSSKVGASS